MLPEEAKRKISESMKRFHANRAAAKSLDAAEVERQADTDRKLYLNVVEEYRRAGVTINVSQDAP